MGKSSTAACRPPHPVSARSACTLTRTSRARSLWNGQTAWARTTSPPFPSNRRAPPHRSGPPKADSKDPAKVSAPNKKQEFKIPDQEYSLEEVAKHNKKEDLWIAVKGIVMNVTDWVDEHPGGPQ